MGKLRNRAPLMEVKDTSVGCLPQMLWSDQRALQVRQLTQNMLKEAVVVSISTIRPVNPQKHLP